MAWLKSFSRLMFGMKPPSDWKISVLTGWSARPEAKTHGPRLAVGVDAEASRRLRVQVGVDDLEREEPGLPAVLFQQIERRRAHRSLVDVAGHEEGDGAHFLVEVVEDRGGLRREAELAGRGHVPRGVALRAHPDDDGGEGQEEQGHRRGVESVEAGAAS